jgi:hypothetical protein
MFTEEKQQKFVKQSLELLQTMEMINADPRYTEERGNQLLNQCLELHKTLTSIQVAEWPQG